MAAVAPEISRDATTPSLLPRPAAIRPVFTGQGSEYFRIWIMNTLLTLLTLGVYSAWAKVRRTRYVWQNTRLDGFVFDYHAKPIAILRGRILALLLFGVYTYSFDFSRTAGVLGLLMLCAVGPWLFMRSQQFKLGNSSWRGLRFGFEADTRQAFRVVLPILLLWFAGTVGAVWYPTDLEVFLWSNIPAIAAIPWMHHRLKGYQHGQACYGDRGFSFQPVLFQFYWVYTKGLVLLVAGVFVGGFFVFSAIEWGPGVAAGSESDRFAFLGGVLSGLLALLMIFLFSWPYLAARIQQSVWSTTRLGGVRFCTSIRARTLFRLTVRNVFLTVATLGLYWPFASMNLARYRIECMSVESDSPLGAIAAGTRSSAVGAAGEGAADFFGLDLGL